MKSFFLILTFLSAPAFADSVKCKVTEAKAGSVFLPFVGGTALVAMADGSTTLFNEAGSYSVLSPELVSSWRAPREACHYAPETIRYSDGTLRAIRYHFNDCVHRVPEQDLMGYVRADVNFDLTSGSGGYREIFLTPTGPVPTAHAVFEGCALVE